MSAREDEDEEETTAVGVEIELDGRYRAVHRPLPAAAPGGSGLRKVPAFDGDATTRMASPADIEPGTMEPRALDPHASPADAEPITLEPPSRRGPDSEPITLEPRLGVRTMGSVVARSRALSEPGDSTTTRRKAYAEAERIVVEEEIPTNDIARDQLLRAAAAEARKTLIDPEVPTAQFERPAAVENTPEVKAENKPGTKPVSQAGKKPGNQPPSKPASKPQSAFPKRSGTVIGLGQPAAPHPADEELETLERQPGTQPFVKDAPAPRPARPPAKSDIAIIMPAPVLSGLAAATSPFRAISETTAPMPRAGGPSDMQLGRDPARSEGLGVEALLEREREAEPEEAEQPHEPEPPPASRPPMESRSARRARRRRSDTAFYVLLALIFVVFTGGGSLIVWRLQSGPVPPSTVQTAQPPARDNAASGARVVPVPPPSERAPERPIATSAFAPPCEASPEPAPKATTPRAPRSSPPPRRPAPPPPVAAAPAAPQVASPAAQTAAAATTSTPASTAAAPAPASKPKQSFEPTEI